MAKIGKDYHEIHALDYFFIYKKTLILSFPFEAPTHHSFLRLPTTTEESLLLAGIATTTQVHPNPNLEPPKH